MSNNVNRVYVFSTSAYSITRQAWLLADANGWNLVLGKYDPTKIKGICIILGNPSNQLDIIIRSLRNNPQIWYLTTEGPVNDPQLIRLQRQIRPYTIAVSHFAKCKFEESGIYIDDVFHHAIRFYNTNINPNKDIRYLYIGGYMERKYPRYSEPIIRRLAGELALVTTRNNPFIRRYKPKILKWSIYDIPSIKDNCDDNCLINLYNRSQFYLNLSDTEGFGLTPLEASSFGVIPILPKHPVFREIFSGIGYDCPIWVELTGQIRHYSFGSIRIEEYVYDTNDFINKALNAKYDANRAKLCQEFANTFYYKERYKKFVEFI